LLLVIKAICWATNLDKQFQDVWVVTNWYMLSSTNADSHFNLNGNNFINFSLIHRCHWNNNDRLCKETFWTHTLQTQYPEGINTNCYFCRHNTALCLLNHSRIRSWNQLVPSNECKVSCSRKQRLVQDRVSILRLLVRRPRRH
jgi:hypothetical protein